MKLSFRCKWILVCTLFCKMMLFTNVKYKKRLMQCYCGTETNSTVDKHGLQETRGETGCLGGVGVYWLFIQTYHARRDTANVIRKLWIYCNYWIAARNNWNHTNVIIKFSRACAGHCLVFYYWYHSFRNVPYFWNFEFPLFLGASILLFRKLILLIFHWRTSSAFYDFDVY